MKSLFLMFAFLGLIPRAVADPWDGYNDPNRFASGYDYQFQNLPLKGEVDGARVPWSESYWPRNQGSINIRWNAPGKPGFDYHSPTKEEVLKMSPTEIAQLAPTEKYDLYRGRYDYPLKNYIASSEADRYAPEWAGICDGWSASAIQLREPRAMTRVNPDGVVIPFGASDVKGLISYTAARQNLQSIVIGRYCPFGLSLGFPNCQDINPGSFHVILANELGIRKTAFPADIDPGKQAWNQPIIGYEFQVLGSAQSDFSENALRIHSRLIYVDELDNSSFEPVTGTPLWKSAVQESDYILELDGNGRIVGGSWLTKYIHPDVFWKPTKAIQFTGEYSQLPELYEPIPFRSEIIK